MQFTASLFPSHLPKRMLDFREQYEHHLILKTSDTGIAEAKDYLNTFFSNKKTRLLHCFDRITKYSFDLNQVRKQLCTYSFLEQAPTKIMYIA